MAQSFEQCDMELRTALFEYHKKDGDFASAAHALAGIALENSPRAWSSVEEKANAVADHYVKVAEVFNRKRKAYRAYTSARFHFCLSLFKWQRRRWTPKTMSTRRTDL